MLTIKISYLQLIHLKELFRQNKTIHNNSSLLERR